MRRKPKRDKLAKKFVKSVKYAHPIEKERVVFRFRDISKKTAGYNPGGYSPYLFSSFTLRFI